MSVKDKILDNFKNGKLAGRTQKEICRLLSIPRGEQKKVSSLLKELCAAGKLCHDERHRYGTPAQFGAIAGTVSANKGGYAFLVPEDKEKYPRDFFIPGRKLRGALHGDKVLAIPCPSAKSDDEVAVISILERGYTEIVGTVLRDKYGYFLRPDETRYTEDICLPHKKTSDYREGVKAVVKITDYPEGRAPCGEITEILGDGDDFFVEELSIIRAHGLREEFPREVQNAAKGVETSVNPKATANRLDLRNKLIITVDGEDTRDIDDAISIERDGEAFILGVHIADVTNYVKPRSPLDKEAFKRGTSVYFPDRVLPMLPRELSNGICSLNEGVDRLTLSCIMRVNGEGKVTDRTVTKSVINSTHRMTYHQIQAIADGDREALAAYPDLREFVKDAYALTRILKNMRQKKGEIELEVKEAKILFDENGEIVIPDYERLLSHEMIEQFMVLANETIAEFITEKKVPFVYRIHEKPKAEKAEELKAFLISLGISPAFSPENVKPQDYRNILEKVAPMPVSSVVNRVMLRSMMKARYDPVNVGHFGLSSTCYCHFTSPIRRYPDLCIHRIIKTVLDEGAAAAREEYVPFVSEAAIQSSECEKKAVEAERDVDDLYKVVYAEKRIGEEYDGVISGVTAGGIFVELPNTVEGYIKYSYLPEDEYEYFSERFLLRGRRNSFRIGENVRIRIAGVDFGERKIDFDFIKKSEEKA